MDIGYRWNTITTELEAENDFFLNRAKNVLSMFPPFASTMILMETTCQYKKCLKFTNGISIERDSFRKYVLACFDVISFHSQILWIILKLKFMATELQHFPSVVKWIDVI